MWIDEWPIQSLKLYVSYNLALENNNILKWFLKLKIFIYTSFYFAMGNLVSELILDELMWSRIFSFLVITVEFR